MFRPPVLQSQTVTEDANPILHHVGPTVAIVRCATAQEGPYSLQRCTISRDCTN